MRDLFRKGDQKVYRKVITKEDEVVFPDGLLHSVYSTYAMGRDFEWSSRLFFIELKEADEEGVGTMLHIEHAAPAFIGEEIVITATVEKIEGKELICAIEARVNDRLVATGKTGQKMLKKDRLSQLFKSTYR